MVVKSEGKREVKKEKVKFEILLHQIDQTKEKFKISYHVKLNKVMAKVLDANGYADFVWKFGFVIENEQGNQLRSSPSLTIDSFLQSNHLVPSDQHIRIVIKFRSSLCIQAIHPSTGDETTRYVRIGLEDTISTISQRVKRRIQQRNMRVIEQRLLSLDEDEEEKDEVTIIPSHANMQIVNLLKSFREDTSSLGWKVQLWQERFGG